MLILVKIFSMKEKMLNVSLSIIDTSANNFSFISLFSFFSSGFLLFITKKNVDEKKYQHYYLELVGFKISILYTTFL